MNFRLLCRGSLLLAFASLLSACLSAPQSAALVQQTDSQSFEPVVINLLPFFSQSAYQCGPAALATMLVYSEVTVSPDDLVPLVYVPERKGSFQFEMVAATRSYERLAYQLAPTLNAVLDEVRAGHPVLVLQNLGLSWYPRWHFAVVKGFDLGRQKIILNSGAFENYEMSLTTFELTWARAQYWAMLVLEPGRMPSNAEPNAYYIALASLEETHPQADIVSGYRSGLRAWPTDQNLLMGYGNLLYQEGRKAEAATLFREVITYHRAYAPAWNNLAQILLDNGDRVEARANVLQAIELGGPFIETYRATLMKIDAAQ
jgi:tetratricopeptide (TPR) repeat protein